MRPLVDLSPLAPPIPVFDPVADDFTLLLADQADTLDALQQQLDPQADQALQDAQLVSDAMDAVGAVFTGIDGTFGHLNDSLTAIDVSGIITGVTATEDSFIDAVGSWVWDLGALAAPILQGIYDLFGAFFNDVIAPIYNSLASLAGEIISLSEAVAQLLYGHQGGPG